ncbi:uncharacterized protein [Elaeis guineensis]|uniref:Uncharacterized protein LOC105052003 n=1 Tax=Elaeis guineensis var. tenera TaxID=51953 RepID=A0A6I9RZR2_ELAGV|nr:uncharacterized protein LOC105052003 [Elaeis guineensis]
MEGNLPTSNMIPYGVLDLQGSMHMHHQHHPQASFHHHQQQPSGTQHQGSMIHPPMHEVFQLTMQDCNHQPAVPVTDYNKGEHGKTSMSDDDDLNFMEDGADGQNEAGNGKKGFPWQRMKWTRAMVRLLITAVSYVGEDAMSEYNSGGRRKYAILQKKGKWKAISKVMAERGCYVSPQQCEDKFNDLNKRYKRLTDILGRGTSCRVVENPALLDQMDISDKLKEDARKILSSKHLFYEEMCSYHNGNRLNLPHDPALQRSLQLVLRSREEHDTRRAVHEDVDEDDQSADTDNEEDDAEEHTVLHGDVGGSCFPKRMKHMVDHEEVGFGNPSGSQDCTRRPYPQSMSVDMNQVLPEGSTVAWGDKNLISSHSLQMEEQRLKIQLQMLELERQRFKWQRFSKKKDRELNKMRMENERMKLENERLALELKRKEFEIDLNSKRNH